MKKITKILVANRGEIAVRIMRTCREMGIPTVAVYSDADQSALHVRQADEAYHIGASQVSESYLNQDKILKVAIESGADAIHPGYGFLSENPQFAEKTVATGLIFIGPSAESMRTMGDKTAARQAMEAAGVPIVPGTAEPLKSAEEAREVARKTGFPVLLKAAAGGGGKGMRVVKDVTAIEASFRNASSEANSAFGDGRVYIEKYLEQPRHIEFQVFADSRGNVIHLGERECSIQRRHQKVIEEAPSSLLDEAMREKMGAAAVLAAKACGYVNAGTIEFLVDKNRDFYFLEMNTRLQVEHPVTEMVTGFDLVRWQIDVARGLSLPVEQKDVRLNGHAVEARIYAEDPANNFLPSIGDVVYLEKPDGPGVRDDSGVTAGDEISVFYDPMIAKLAVCAENRELAIERMVRALEEYRVGGVHTTIPFCRWAVNHEKFRSGMFDTHFVEDEYFAKNAGLNGDLGESEEHALALAAVLGTLQNQRKTAPTQSPATERTSAWRQRGWK